MQLGVPSIPVLNSDIWLTAVGNSQYWQYVSKTVTLYGGALESITLDGNSFVTTNSNGSTTTSVPYGTHTYKGSVSGESFTRTVAKDTTKVYARPEKSLYWFGASDYTWSKSKFTYSGESSQISASDSEIVNQTNCVVLNTSNQAYYFYYSCNTLKSVTTSNTIHIYTDSSNANCFFYPSSDFVNNGNIGRITEQGNTSQKGYIHKYGNPTSNGNAYITLLCETNKVTFYAVWIE